MARICVFDLEDNPQALRDMRRAFPEKWVNEHEKEVLGNLIPIDKKIGYCHNQDTKTGLCKIFEKRPPLCRVKKTTGKLCGYCKKNC